MKKRAVLILSVVVFSLVLAVPAFAQTPAPIMTGTSDSLLNDGLDFITAAGVGIVIGALAILMVFGVIMRKTKGAVR